MFRVWLNFFDKLEDKIRGSLSRYPIAYAVIGGIGIVLFWRGVWLTADLFQFMTGPVSLLLGTVMLLSMGLFVSFFIGDHILITGLKHEKKLIEKIEKAEATEIKTETDILNDINKKLGRMEKKLKKLPKR